MTARRPVRRPAVETLEDRRLFSTVVAIAGANTLIYFNSGSPNTVATKVQVKGLVKKESLLAIDFRPADGALYALGSSSRVYRINPSSGQATALGSAPFTPALAGAEFGVDFNPSTDRLRVVSDADSNFRMDVDSGVIEDFDPGTNGVQTDLALTYAVDDAGFGANPSIIAIAQSNNVPAGSPTALYGIDSDRDVLVRIGSLDGVTDPASNGNVSSVGPLGVSVGAIGGMDIETIDGVDTAFAALAGGSKAKSRLYTINLSTGAATDLGQIKGSDKPLRDLAVVPVGRGLLVVDKSNQLFTVDGNLPSLKSAPLKIKGLTNNEKIVSLDEEPGTNRLLGYSSKARVYAIDKVTGDTNALGPANDFKAGKNAVLDMDVNPTGGALRVVDTADQNARFSAVDGQLIDSDEIAEGVQVDGPIVYATTDVNAGSPPDVSGIAYGSNVQAALATTLYGIDTKSDTLVTIGTVDGTTSPNTGSLFTVGSLGVKVKGLALLDISTTAGVDSAFAILTKGDSGPSLYRVDLATGAASLVGKLAKGVKPVGMAIELA